VSLFVGRQAPIYAASVRPRLKGPRIVDVLEAEEENATIGPSQIGARVEMTNGVPGVAAAPLVGMGQPHLVRKFTGKLSAMGAWR
jgi:hypothetical protein